MRRAIEEPLRWIAQNGGVEGSIVVEKVKGGTGSFGYNVRVVPKNTYLVDAAEMGLVAVAH